MEQNSIRNSTYIVFRNHLLKIIRQVSNPVNNIQNYISLKLLTRLRLGLSHLNEHRFNHNFQNCINPLCTCSLEVESTAHFFLHCHHYHNIRAKLLNSLDVIDTNLLKGVEATCMKIATEIKKMFQTEINVQFQCSLKFSAHISMF